MAEHFMNANALTFDFGIGMLEGIIDRIKPLHAPGDFCRPTGTVRKPIERQADAIEATIKHLFDKDRQALIKDIEMSGGKTFLLASTVAGMMNHTPLDIRLVQRCKAAGIKLKKRNLSKGVRVKHSDSKKAEYTLTLKDGSVKTFAEGIEVEAFLESIGARAATYPRVGWKANGCYNILYIAPTTCIAKVTREMQIDIPNVKVVDLTGTRKVGNKTVWTGMEKLSKMDTTTPGVTIWTIGLSRLSMHFDTELGVLETPFDRKRADVLDGYADKDKLNPDYLKAYARCPKCGSRILGKKNGKETYLTVADLVKAGMSNRKRFCSASKFPNAKTAATKEKKCGAYLGDIVKKWEDRRTFSEKLRLPDEFDQSGVYAGVISPREKAKKFDTPEQLADRQKTNNEKWNGQQRSVSLGYFISKKFKGKFDMVIADELQHIRNDTAKAENIMRALQSVSCKGKKIGATGTLVGGYPEQTWNFCWAGKPTCMTDLGYTNTESSKQRFIDTYGATEHRTVVRNGKTVRLAPRRRKGMSTRITQDLLGGWCLSILLLEIAPTSMVPYKEHLLGVPLSPAMRIAYDNTTHEVLKAAREARAKGFNCTQQFLSRLLHARWAGVDNLAEDVIDMVLEKKDPVTKAVIETLPVSIKIPPINEPLSPKEAATIDKILAIKATGQTALVLTAYTGKHDTSKRLKQTYEAAGLRVGILRSETVDALKREEWIAKITPNIDVLICHPGLISEGLDLLPYTSIFVYTPAIFDLYMLRQAIRRSWRLNQTFQAGCDIYFCYYEDTAQEDALIGISTGLDTAMIASGNTSESELFDLSEYGEGDIIRNLVASLEAAIAEGAINSQKIRPSAFKGNETEMQLAMSAAEILAAGGVIPVTDPTTGEKIAELVQTVEDDGSIKVIAITRFVKFGRKKMAVTETIGLDALQGLQDGPIQYGFVF